MLINIAVGEKREHSNYRFIYSMLVHICTKGCRSYCKKLYMAYSEEQVTSLNVVQFFYVGF